jgi:hypothetical protein
VDRVACCGRARRGGDYEWAREEFHAGRSCGHRTGRHIKVALPALVASVEAGGSAQYDAPRPRAEPSREPKRRGPAWRVALAGAA